MCIVFGAVKFLCAFDVYKDKKMLLLQDLTYNNMCQAKGNGVFEHAQMHRFRFIPRMRSLIRTFALHLYIL